MLTVPGSLTANTDKLLHLTGNFNSILSPPRSSALPVDLAVGFSPMAQYTAVDENIRINPFLSLGLV
jgi:hypothetical protein